jgi:hypothetical protein
VLRVDKHVELTKFRSGESELTKIHCQQSQVMKNISNVPNFHGVTNFRKISQIDEVRRVVYLDSGRDPTVSDLI